MLSQPNPDRFSESRRRRKWGRAGTWSAPGLSRRAFLLASSVGVSGLTFGQPGKAETEVSTVGKGASAKSTILFFLSGGASHIDMWDMKPDAPAEYRGPFQPIETSAPGVRLCEHLPLLAKQAHHLAIVNSVGGIRMATTSTA